jgi:FlaA1/EpsC-like NDP-sugar epimerase
MIEQTDFGGESWDKRVLITGVCGTVGRELLHQVIRQSPSEVIGFDNNETGLLLMAEEYRAKPRVRFYLATFATGTT